MLLSSPKTLAISFEKSYLLIQSLPAILNDSPIFLLLIAFQIASAADSTNKKLLYMSFTILTGVLFFPKIYKSHVTGFCLSFGLFHPYIVIRRIIMKGMPEF